MVAQLQTAMTYNIRLDVESDNENNWHNRKGELLNLLKYYSPDVFGVQEALPHQVNYLDSSLVNYSFVGVGRDDGSKKGEFSAIFYKPERFKVVKSETFWLSETPTKVTFGWDAACKRICTYALLKNLTSKKQFWVFNTHFDHQGEKARIESANLIVQKIVELTKITLPIILMGDFNMPPEHKSIKTISKLLADAYNSSTTKPYGPKGTFCSFDTQKTATKRIDFIFVNDLKIKRYRHIEDRRENNLRISDHLPVLIEFD
jgi:endonuclease/exonuclease/phosphatase family metal-dependent hydrolase